jgi:hypothetical protein
VIHLSTAGLSVLLCLACAAGCAPALREPPDLRQGREPARLSRDQAAERLRDASTLFDVRETAPVLRAAEILRDLAAAADDPLDALLLLVQVQVWLVEHESDPDVREALAVGAVHAGQWCRETTPENPRCLYRLAIAVGVQARERPGTGIDAMATMVELLEAARAGDAAQDHGGPDRVLALAFLRAPGWPTGPGDPDLGYDHAVAATGFDPDYPPNQLVLGEALEAIDREDEAAEAYRTALNLACEQHEIGVRDAREWRLEAESALSRFGELSLSKPENRCS